MSAQGDPSPEVESILKGGGRARDTQARLERAATDLIVGLFVDPRWHGVETALQHLARDHSIDGILRRQHAAMDGIRDSFLRFQGTDVSGETDKSELGSTLRAPVRDELRAELRATAAAFRAQSGKLAEQIKTLHEAAESAKKNPHTAQAVETINSVVQKTSLSELTPVGVALVLLWLVFHLSGQDIAALTLWYIVLSDYLKGRSGSA
jgi:hypothetical protein